MPHLVPAAPPTATTAGGIGCRARGPLRVLRRVVSALLALCVVALTLALTAVAALPAVNARAMAVTSGSMQPGIAVGSLLIVRTVDPETVRVGDVITYAGYTAQNLTTHRVLSLRHVSGKLHFQTQGDANDAPDVDLAPAAGLVGRATLDVPYAGRTLSALTHPQTRIIVLGVPAAWMIVVQGRALHTLLRSRGRHRAARPPMVSSPLAPMCLLVAVAASSAVALPAARAVLTDTQPITGNSFATGSWSAL
jgi:signal peptidase